MAKHQEQIALKKIVFGNIFILNCSHTGCVFILLD